MTPIASASWAWGEALALALLGEPVAGLVGHELLAAPFGLFRAADALKVGGAVPLGVSAHQLGSSSARGAAGVATPAHAADLIDYLRSSGRTLSYDPSRRTLRSDTGESVTVGAVRS